MTVYGFAKATSPFWLSCLQIAVLLLTRSLVEAQEKSTLRVQVELATVEVVVLGHHGGPVLNLSQEDFTVLENGKERKILSFDIIRESARNNLPRSLGELDEQSRKGKVVLIFFDDGSIAPSQVLACREAAARYVREHMEPWDLFAVARFGTHLIVDQNLTGDVGAVETALRQPAASVLATGRRFRANPDLLPDASVSLPSRNSRRNQVDSRRTQVDLQSEDDFREANLARSLDSLGVSLALVKGRKSILYFGSTLSAVRASAGASGSSLRGAAGSNLYKVVESAAEQKVTYYPVDPRDSFALNKGMKHVQDELSQYYVLGYQPAEGMPEKPREIELKCRVSGVKLKYLKQQMGRRPADALAGAPAEESLLKAVNSGTLLSQVPLTLRVAHFPGADNLNWVTISAQIKRSGVKFNRKNDTLVARINTLGAAFDPERSLAARFSESFSVAFDRAQKEAAQGQAIPYRHTMKLPSGHYSFRLAVSDEQGKIGMVEKEIDIPKAQSEQLTISSLIVSQQMSLLPDLVRDINAELLQNEDPLLVNGIQIELPVEYKLSRQTPIIVFYEVSNFGDRDAAKRLVSNIQFVSESGSITSFPPMPLSEVVQVNNLGVARIALKLPIAGLPKGVQTLRVETTLGRTGKSVVAQESVEITE